MNKWLKLVLFVVVLLLVGAMLADNIILHHTLADFTLETNHTTQYAADPGGNATGFSYLHSSSCLSLLKPQHVKNLSGVMLQCFCGWHNSSYLDVPLVEDHISMNPSA